MNKFITGLILSCGLLFSSTADAKVTAGLTFGIPEIFGAHASYFPNNNFSVDGQLTLSTLDAGVTAHIPISRSFDERHSVLLSGLLGYSHNLVGTFTYNGLHSLVGAGYGYQTASGWDLRALAGVAISAAPKEHYNNTEFSGRVVIGHTF